MSMYEIEGLMENTVTLIDKSEATSPQKRNLIWNAYELQGAFDCSFTHFRVMPLLQRNEFVQTYEREAFPMYQDFSAFFDGLEEESFTWICENPAAAWSGENGAIAYWDKDSKKVFVDFGSPYYSLHPEEKPQKIAPLDFGWQMIQTAHLQNNQASIYDWTAFMIFYLIALFPTEQSTEVLKETYFTGIKSIFKNYDYTNYEPLHDGLDLHNKEEEEWLTDQQKELLVFLLG